MVFQHFALFPHRNVLENAGYGLEVQGVPRAERERRAAEALALCGLEGWEKSWPDELSGGMQQRVGLARALATDAELLLMDESFSALDPLIRRDMQDQLLELQRTLKKTIVFITHDLNEAMRLGDGIAVMRDGRIVQQGTAEDILTRPADDYVASFIQDVDRSRVLTADAVMDDPEPAADACDCPTVTAGTPLADLCAVSAGSRTRLPSPARTAPSSAPYPRTASSPSSATSSGPHVLRGGGRLMPRLHLGAWVDHGVDFLQSHLSWLFEAVSVLVTGLYDGIDTVLSAPAPLLFAGILAVAAWWLRGLLAGLLAFAGFALVDSLGLWEDAMSTLSLVLVATLVTLAFAIPLGIWASRSDRVSALLRPVLDFMQTM